VSSEPCRAVDNLQLFKDHPVLHNLDIRYFFHRFDLPTYQVLGRNLLLVDEIGEHLVELSLWALQLCAKKHSELGVISPRRVEHLFSGVFQNHPRLGRRKLA
jgi:hypothetical protein